MAAARDGRGKRAGHLYEALQPEFPCNLDEQGQVPIWENSRYEQDGIRPRHSRLHTYVNITMSMDHQNEGIKLLTL